MIFSKENGSFINTFEKYTYTYTTQYTYEVETKAK